MVDAKKFKIETADVEIKVNPDALERIETRRIDGKECLVITVDDRVTVNGMSVRTMKKKKWKNSIRTVKIFVFFTVLFLSTKKAPSPRSMS